MPNKMLIDAAHPEETRVVVVRGNRVEEFDFESASRKQLRGNIYLAKVTRVEPSLQAAFVEYGGNRHGFLAFSEIHPDYYQIPVADRQALLADEERHAAEEAEAEENAGNSGRGRGRGRRSRARKNTGDTVSSEVIADAEEASAEAGSDEAVEAVSSDEAPHDDAPAEAADASHDDHDGDHADEHSENGDHAEEHVESVGVGDAMEEMPERTSPRRGRQYKIQEVIKRRQVLLVQAVKEERGNKGAALTTYLSLAGRYCVLMPNTARGGGISRKITNAADRKKMKEIAGDLDVPEGMGVILRTAGANRTKAEIKRDFEYLLRLWETVRETTLESSAPSLVYEEGSLVKRAIRDLYNRDIDEIQVAGDAAHREAKDFMRMLMPSHAKNVKLYRDPLPIFTRFGVESQLDAMFSSTVHLKSGGYIVINQTEALVAIDVNSGRSTREHNIEDTALRTNLEAAEEVSRQLRLRDLAGLIVVDFIDMEEGRNNRAVEKKLKDCLKNDRARIQVGRISHFGLLEMSRQRIRTGVLESSSEVCPVCAGSGLVRSTPSVALHVLRMIEDNLLRNAGYNITVRTRGSVALYILNQKRGHLREIENQFGIDILFVADDHLPVLEHCQIQRGEPATGKPNVGLAPPAPEEEDEDVADEAAEAEERSESPRHAGEEDGNGNGNGRRRRRRRRRRGGRDREQGAADGSEDNGHDAEGTEEGENAEPVLIEAVEESSAADAVVAEGEETATEKPRRRRTRGGRRRSGAAAAASDEANAEEAAAEEAPAATEPPSDVEPESAPEPEVQDPAVTITEEAEAQAPEAQTPQESASQAEPAQPAEDEPPRPRRSGWWDRLRG